jgi:hypothetical protein
METVPLPAGDVAGVAEDHAGVPLPLLPPPLPQQPQNGDGATGDP